MAANLFIIEAPGKRQNMANLLWKAGLRDVEVMATVGHIGTNPEGFKPLGISVDYCETAYRLKPEKERLAAEIGLAAKRAQKIYVATDDDQEGDVIARDVLRFCIDDEDHTKVLRLRLKALAPAEVSSALSEAGPFDSLSAARGDARRTIDRLIGALSDENGAIGRVQGSLLLMLQNQFPVIGTATYTLPSDDDKGCWVATMPVFAGQPIPTDVTELDWVASVGRSVIGTLSKRVMNHDDILLSASLETGFGVNDISKSMQTLYESGKMTYPRAKDHAITADAFRRVQAIARINGAGFDADRFRAIRDASGFHGHEAPNSMALDIPVNRNLNLMSLDEQVLVHIARGLINCGIPCLLETPRMVDVARLPEEMASLNWHRLIPTGERLWEVKPISAGFTAWTPEQSLLHFMSKNELGRPSTMVNHITKFLSRDLVDENFEFTNKGREWCHNVGAIFGHQNISKMIENYIDNNQKPPGEMVADMIQLCGLEKVDSAIQNQERLEENDDETYEISSGDFS